MVCATAMECFITRMEGCTRDNGDSTKWKDMDGYSTSQANWPMMDSGSTTNSQEVELSTTKNPNL